MTYPADTKTIKAIKDLDNFNPKKAEVALLIEGCEKLEINGIEDKEGYGKVHEARMKLLRTRTNTRKQGKEARDYHNQMSKAIIKLENEIVAIIEPTERLLEGKQKLIDEQIESIKRQELLPERNERLQKIEVEMEDSYLLLMDDKHFEKFFSEKKEEYLNEKEIKIKEAQKKLDHDKEIEDAKKQARIDAENKAEIDKQKAIDDVKRIADKEKQDLIDSQKKKDDDRIAKEKDDKRIKDKEASDKKEKDDELKKQKKYTNWLNKNGYTKETVNEFYISKDDETNTFTIYKKLDEITIK